MRDILALHLLIVSLFAALPAFADFSGAVRVKDADTIEVAGVSVRLHAIDAPEVAQKCGGGWACGRWATNRARDLFEGHQAKCHPIEQDRYGRTVARCSVAGQDMGRLLVRQGMAVAYRKYGMDYVADEALAAQAQRGLHRTTFDAPEDYRAKQRQAQPKPKAQQLPATCRIKGNISRKGARIFHSPGQTWYEKTVIREADGERWFCSAAQARAAGWRAARR